MLYYTRSDYYSSNPIRRWNSVRHKALFLSRGDIILVQILGRLYPLKFIVRIVIGLIGHVFIETSDCNWRMGNSMFIKVSIFREIIPRWTFLDSYLLHKVSSLTSFKVFLFRRKLMLCKPWSINYRNMESMMLVILLHRFLINPRLSNLLLWRRNDPAVRGRTKFIVIRVIVLGSKTQAAVTLDFGKPQHYSLLTQVIYDSIS